MPQLGGAAPGRSLAAGTFWLAAPEWTFEGLAKKTHPNP